MLDDALLAASHRSMVNNLSVESIALPSQLDLGYILQIVLSAAKSQWHGCDLLALARV